MKAGRWDSFRAEASQLAAEAEGVARRRPPRRCAAAAKGGVGNDASLDSITSESGLSSAEKSCRKFFSCWPEAVGRVQINIRSVYAEQRTSNGPDVVPVVAPHPDPLPVKDGEREKRALATSPSGDPLSILTFDLRQ